MVVCEAFPDNVALVGKEYADPIAFALDSKDLEIKQLSDIVDAQKRTAATSKARSIYYRAPEQLQDEQKLPSLYSLMNPELKKPLIDDALDAAGGVGGEDSREDRGGADGNAVEGSAAGGSGGHTSTPSLSPPSLPSNAHRINKSFMRVCRDLVTRDMTFVLLRACVP